MYKVFQLSWIEMCYLKVMLKLKLQYFGHLMWTADLLEKTWMLRKIEGGGEGGDRGWDGWMASPTQWTRIWANSGDSGGQRSLACCSLWACKESDMTYRWYNIKGYRVFYRIIFLEHPSASYQAHNHSSRPTNKPPLTFPEWLMHS